MDIDLSKYIPSITRILSNSDLNVVSAWDVRSNLEQNYSIDLNSRKKEVRKIVQLCYNKICDKEEEMMEVERYEIEGEKELKNKRKREDEDYEVDEVEGGRNKKKNKKAKKDETEIHKNVKIFNKKRINCKTINKYLNGHDHDRDHSHDHGHDHKKEDNTHKCTNEVEEGNEDDMVEVEEIEEVVVASGEAIMYNVNKEEIEGEEGVVVNNDNKCNHELEEGEICCECDK